MRKRIITAAIIIALSIAAYPEMEHYAMLERGYSAIGGEEALLLFGVFLALYILVGGLSSQQKKKSDSQKATASHTESKQSESKSL